MPEEGNAGEKVVFYIVFGIVFSVIVLFLAFILVQKGSDTNVIPSGLELYLLEQRFLQQCFAHFDPDILRTFPEYIDWDIFTPESMQSCYTTSNPDLPAFQLVLTSEGASRTISSNNWNEDEPPAKREVKSVLVYRDTNIQAGDLEIEIQ